MCCNFPIARAKTSGREFFVDVFALALFFVCFERGNCYGYGCLVSGGGCACLFHAVQLLNSEDQFTKNTGNIDVSQNVKRTEIKRNIMTKFDYTIGTKTGLNCRHVGQLVIRARAFVGTTITREYLSRGFSP